MESVLWKRYHGKLKHRVVALHEVLPPPSRLSIPVATSSQSLGSSSATGDQSAPDVSLSTGLISCPLEETSAEDMGNRKDGIISSSHHAMRKQKVVQAMSEPTSEGSFIQISRRVMQCLGHIRLLSSTSSPHDRVLVNPMMTFNSMKVLRGRLSSPLSLL